jgi:hypothetical protein
MEDPPPKRIRHREPPLGGVAIQGRPHRAGPLDCFVAKRLLAMTVALSSMGIGQRPIGNAQ